MTNSFQINLARMQVEKEVEDAKMHYADQMMACDIYGNPISSSGRSGFGAHSHSVSDPGHSHTVTGSTRPKVGSKEYLLKLLCMRLRLQEGDKLPFEHLDFHIGQEKIFVFVVHNNQPVTLHDDAASFPSDKLVAELTMFRK